MGELKIGDKVLLNGGGHGVSSTYSLNRTMRAHVASEGLTYVIQLDEGLMIMLSDLEFVRSPG